jgi:hypothetical protein
MDTYPPAERSQAAVRAPTTRSKATNKPRKQVLSGNTTQGRRLLDLADAYADGLGGWSKLTDMQAAAVRAAAELTVLAEEARHNALRNGCGDPDQLIRLEGAVARAVRRLGLGRKRERDAISSALDGLILPPERDR